MEITLDSQRDIARSIVNKYNSGKPTCIKQIVHNSSKEFIHCVYNRFPALCAKRPTTTTQRDFFVVIQHCLFIHTLYTSGLIIIDRSLKNEACNDYSSQDYEHFSFKKVCGDENIGRFVCDNWSLSIIPTTDLIQLVNDNFRTTEHKRYRCQTFLTCISIVIAIAIGVLSPILNQCASKDEEQVKLERIEAAIKAQKSVTIDSIRSNPSDTFNVKIVQPCMNSEFSSESKSLTEKNQE